MHALFMLSIYNYEIGVGKFDIKGHGTQAEAGNQNFFGEKG